MPTLRLSKECTFAAAHFLPAIEENLHGHTFRVRVTIEGELDERGLVMNFDELKHVIQKTVIGQLDHQYLNTIVEPPTAERIALWIWERLSRELPGLVEICVWISPESMVTYRGV